MIEDLKAEALICFCLASLAQYEGRYDECERLTKRAAENLVSTCSTRIIRNLSEADTLFT